jgi:hypothetical protein
VLAEEYVHAHVTLARQLRWIRVDRGGGPPMPAARAFAIPGDRLVELEPGPRGAVLWWSAGLGYNLATFAFDGAFSPIDRLWLGAARIAHATAGEGEMRLVLDEPRDRITAATVPELQAAPAPLVTPGMLGGRPAVCGNDYYAYVRGVTDGDGDGINDTHLTRYRWGCPEGFVAMPGAAANTSGDLVCSDSQVVTVAFRPSPSAPDTYERLVASYARDGRPLGRYVLADSRLLATAHLAGHVFVLFDAPEPAQPFLFYDLSEDGAATTYPLSRPGGTGRLSPDRLWTQTANLEVDDREIRLAWPDDAGNIHLSFWSRP